MGLKLETMDLQSKANMLGDEFRSLQSRESGGEQISAQPGRFAELHPRLHLEEAVEASLKAKEATLRNELADAQFNSQRGGLMLILGARQCRQNQESVNVARQAIHALRAELDEVRA